MVSMKITVMVVTLCILATNIHAVHIYCCVRYVRGRPPFSEIRGFSVQKVTPSCAISAIIFHTKKGKICANASLDWVIDYVTHIEKLAKNAPMAGKRPDRIATDQVKQREYITEKVHPEVKPEDSISSVSDKIIEDGPLPMTLCKW